MSTNPTFGTVTATAVTTGTLSASTYGGSGLASSADAIAGTAGNKVVTPMALRSALATAPPIGATTAGPGIFTTLSASSISGTACAAVSDVQAINSSKIATAATVAQVFQTPIDIGSRSQAKGSFTDLTAATINGGVIAQASDTSSTNKVVTPSALTTRLAAPTPIGSATPNTGKFTTLTATSATLSTPLGPASGGSGFNSFSKGDIVVATGTTATGKVSLGAPGYVLTVSSSAPTGVAWAAIPTPTATMINAGYTTLATGPETQQLSITGKSVTPNSLASAFAAPPKIGSTTANDAVFNNLTAGTIAGNVVAQSTDTTSTNSSFFGLYK